MYQRLHRWGPVKIPVNPAKSFECIEGITYIPAPQHTRTPAPATAPHPHLEAQYDDWRHSLQGVVHGDIEGGQAAQHERAVQAIGDGAG